MPKQELLDIVEYSTGEWLPVEADGCTNLTSDEADKVIASLRELSSSDAFLEDDNVNWKLGTVLSEVVPTRFGYSAFDVWAR